MERDTEESKVDKSRKYGTCSRSPPIQFQGLFNVNMCNFIQQITDWFLYAEKKGTFMYRFIVCHRKEFFGGFLGGRCLFLSQYFVSFTYRLSSGSCSLLKWHIISGACTFELLKMFWSAANTHRKGTNLCLPLIYELNSRTSKRKLFLFSKSC